MSDRQTGSIWSHFEGAAISGTLAGARLDFVPMAQTTWGEWQTLFPQTVVLDIHTGFEPYYRMGSEVGRAGLGPEFQRTILNWDDRLPENELVLGTTVGDEFRAYVLGDFGDGIGALEDTLGGQPIVVFYNSRSSYAAAYFRGVGNQTLTFSADGETIGDAAGNPWGLDGKCRSGGCVGQSLSFVTSFVTEWYGWAAYHPQTSIYGR